MYIVAVLSAATVPSLRVMAALVSTNRRFFLIIVAAITKGSPSGIGHLNLALLLAVKQPIH